MGLNRSYQRKILPDSQSITELALVESKLHEILSQAEGLTRDVCLNLLQAGGKRLRPLLTLQSGMIFAPLNTGMLDAAVAGELIHMASLVHDDVIDEGMVRRGVPTINSDLGNHAAVLAGDFIFARAFTLLSTLPQVNAMQYMCQAIQAMCTGEVNQAREQFDPGVSVTQYFRRAGQKTSALLVACCKAGAACGGATEKQLDAMEKYGSQMGYAYQIMDDLTDYMGEPAQTGKPLARDLSQGHITLPLILLLHDPAYHHRLKEIIRNKMISREEYQQISDLLHKTGCMDKTISIAVKCIDKAKSSLNGLPDNRAKGILVDLAEQLMVKLF